MSLYICDIDGTLANNSHRNPYDESKVLYDTPLPTCKVIKDLIDCGNDIVFFSGRTKACYDDTIQWLKTHLNIDEPLLYMREIGDNRKDEIVKREMYNKYIPNTSYVSGVFDDRKRVKRMWVSLGLWVFDCNQEDKEF